MPTNKFTKNPGNSNDLTSLRMVDWGEWWESHEDDFCHTEALWLNLELAGLLYGSKPGFKSFVYQRASVARLPLRRQRMRQIPNG